MSKFSAFMKANKKVKENEKFAPTASLLGSDGTPVRWEFRHISSKENEELRDADVYKRQELNNTLTQNIILGKDPQKAIDEIARKMNTSKTNAGRLVMTEEAFFSSAAQKDCFTELDVEQFEICLLYTSRCV